MKPRVFIIAARASTIPSPALLLLTSGEIWRVEGSVCFKTFRIIQVWRGRRTILQKLDVENRRLISDYSCKLGTARGNLNLLCLFVEMSLMSLAATPLGCQVCGRKSGKDPCYATAGLGPLFLRPHRLCLHLCPGSCAFSLEIEAEGNRLAAVVSSVT